MKILIFSTQRSHRWGGSEELWYQTAVRLREMGHEIAISIRKWDPPLEQARVLAEKGCMLYERVENASGPILTTEFPWLEEFKPDAVIISLAWFSEGGRFMRRCMELKIPYFNIIQAAGDNDWPVDETANILKTNFENASCNFFVSHVNKLNVETVFGLELPKCEMIFNPVKVNYHINIKWPSIAHGYKLAFVARLEPASKAQDVLFHVLKQKKWKERDLYVTLFGKGFNEELLKRLAAMYELSKVTFAGHVSNVESIWETHHALILPSRIEGLPIALMEAMLCQRTAISTAVAGIPEVLTDGQTGFIAPAPTPDLLDAALEYAWVNRSKWRHMGIEAGKNIRGYLPEDPIADFIVKFGKLAGISNA